MKIFSLFGKKDVSGELSKQAPYRIMTELVPYKLYSNRKSNVMMLIKIKNMTSEPLLSSVVIELPKGISFDEMGLANSKEIRIGELAPNEEKEIRADIYSNSGTEKGEYTVVLTAFAHYRDYGHVLNAMKKRSVIEVV
ncbi:MAG: hypothetical protein ACP5P2_02145 [Candidatus Micrarchaeia archaeon]|jgi:uncharacterized membrane protein